MKKHQVFMVGLLNLALISFFSGNLKSEESNLSKLFHQGEAEYERQQYHQAADTFNLLVLKYPKCVECLHMRGKTYGRLAENSSWLKAIALVPKALASFETAHSLAPEKEEIMKDLITFYEEAPFFLGGDTTKAEKLKKQLKTLKPTPKK